MADAAFAADAYNGGQIAQRWCEPCHVVVADQRGTTGEAPPFATIAKRPGFDASQIAMFLLDPHPKMPDMSLTRTEAGDLAAYIASLGKWRLGCLSWPGHTGPRNFSEIAWE